MTVPVVCEHCRYWADPERPPETFVFALIEFSVEKAKEIVSDLREPVEISESSVRYALSFVIVSPEHARHIDHVEPGIAVTIQMRNADAPGLMVIDGHHRARRCLELGVPFRVRVLTPAESMTVIQRGKRFVKPPKKSEAW